MTIINWKSTVKNICLLLSLFLFFSGCSGMGKKNEDEAGNRYSFSDSSAALKKSSDTIDKGITYEISFSLAESVECITVDLQAVQVQSTFPPDRIPQKTYFIIEKLIDIKRYRSKTDYTYSPMARNYNNEWETFYPVKICGLKDDPLSKLDSSTYRVRFTVFDPEPVVFMITVTSDAEITFKTDN